ncbi:Glycogen phosphorylase, liver form [Dirofilaria immitis]
MRLRVVRTSDCTYNSILLCWDLLDHSSRRCKSIKVIDGVFGRIFSTNLNCTKITVGVPRDWNFAVFYCVRLNKYGRDIFYEQLAKKRNNI